MDQSISYSGTSFTQAYFWYGNSAGAPFTRSGFGFTKLIELLDNISYTYVPEPSSALAVAVLLGQGAFGLRLRRSKN